MSWSDPAGAHGVRVAVEDPRDPEARAMIAALDAYHDALYPPENNYLLDPEELARPEVCFLVARDAASGAALGCGALRRIDARLGEVKRMWTVPAARGRGVAALVLAAIEREARRQGLAALKLETGTDQPEALRFYARHGFERCAAFGDYRPSPLNLFYEKRLG